jgi:Flp pilus assembly protein TadD
LEPKNALAHNNLCVIYIELKKYTDAIACAQEAIRLDPKISTAHVMLGFALQETGDISGARVALTEAARLDPKRFGSLLTKLPPIPLAPPPREVKP